MSAEHLPNSEMFSHLREVWPNHEMKEFTWALGKIRDVLPDLTVVRVAPESEQDPWIYITSGANSVSTTHGDRLEFFLMCPDESPRHIETLAMLSSYFAQVRNDLQEGHSVNIGRGWIEGSDCDRLLVSLPYPYGPILENFDLKGNSVRYLWLLPIDAAEDEYLRVEGLEALEQRFDDAGINFLDPHRRSVIGH